MVASLCVSVGSEQMFFFFWWKGRSLILPNINKGSKKAFHFDGEKALMVFECWC